MVTDISLTATLFRFNYFSYLVTLFYLKLIRSSIFQTGLLGIVSPLKTSIFIPLSLLYISSKSTTFFISSAVLSSSPSYPTAFSSKECTSDIKGTSASLKIDFRMYVVSSGEVIQTHGQILLAAKSFPVLRNWSPTRHTDVLSIDELFYNHGQNYATNLCAEFPQEGYRGMIAKLEHPLVYCRHLPMHPCLR